jgi:oligopeptidase A
MNALYEFARAGGLPPFDRISADQVIPAVRTLLAEFDRRLTAIESNIRPDWDSAIEAQIDLAAPLERVWRAVEHLMAVRNTPPLRDACRQVLPNVIAASLRLRQSVPLHEALNALRADEGFAALARPRQRILDKRLLDARFAGVALGPPEQQRFNQISSELFALSARFANNALDATKQFVMRLSSKDEVDGLPATALEMAAATARALTGGHGAAECGPWCFTLDIPSYEAFMRHATRRDLREMLHRAYLARASELEFTANVVGAHDNIPVIDRILQLRFELAILLGFETYASLSLASKMARSVGEVERFLETLRAAVRPVADAEIEDLQSIAGTAIDYWDVVYWSERRRERRHGFTEEELRPYFPLPRVLEGLFALVKRLFAVRIIDATEHAPRWHDDVRYFEMIDETGANIAAFYLDPFVRPAGKRHGAWTAECIRRRRTGSAAQLPVAYLCCNHTRPSLGRPALMTLTEIVTLFHEFGHVLAHTLTQVDDADSSGIGAIEWDAVELPSKFMEYWCTDKATLVGLSRHFETGEPLPGELGEKACAALSDRSAIALLQEIGFSRLDLELHNGFRAGGFETIFDVQKRLAPASSVLPLFDGDRFICCATHLFAGRYAAGYYSYLWAEVLAADAFSAFEETGLNDDSAVKATGRRFRDTVLGLGGSAHPSKVFRAFRGRDPSMVPMLRKAGIARSGGATL